MFTIRMYSKADMTKGHGVLSAHDEQVALIKNYLPDDFKIAENGSLSCQLNHFHTINPEFLLKAWIGRIKGIKNVGYVHFLPETLKNSIQLPRPIQYLFYKYVLFFYRQMDALVTVNPYFIDVLESYGISRDKVTYIPNVVSSKKFFRMTPGEKEKARSHFHLHENGFTVLCAGQLQKRKGVLDFVQMAMQMPQIHFVWAGDFSFGKISKDYELIRRVVSNPPKNLTFLGLVDHEEMNLLYNACDMMLLPSYEELFPMTVLEAMSCGLPIVVRKLEIYDNILFDFVQYARTTPEFIEYIRHLSEDPDFYSHCCRQSKAGSIKYSENAVANQWRKYYTAIITGGSAQQTLASLQQQNSYTKACASSRSVL